MAENQLLPFANGDTANVIPFADWNGLSVRLTGFQSGIASSQQFNRILGQGGAAGYVIGQFVADFTTDNATINATALYASFKKALAAFVPGNIADGSISTNKIANGAITNAKLANDAVTSAKLADNSVGTEHIQSNAVTADEIAAGAVGTSELANGSVTFPKIASAAIATQQQAEAGTATNVLMTPQRVKQAIDEAFESDLPMASATQLGGVKITGEDGITINGSGEIAVDFSKMPTDKFEDLLKSIRVPIWLTRTTQFYVNDATGSDELDEGRGLTSGKPFKTIQKCVNFIADNYNLSTFSVLINIADGTYNESVTLPSYTSSTGNIALRASNPYMVTISAVDESCLSAYGEATYNVQYINFKLTINAQTEGNRHGISMIYVDGATIKFTGFNCETTYNGDFTNGLVYNVTFSAINYGNIEFYPGTKPYSAAYNNSANPCQVYAYWLQRFSQVLFHATYDASVAVNLLFSVSGVLGSSTTYGIFMRCSGSSKFINQVYTYTNSFSGTLSNCRRYSIESGSSCETNGQGADFFPGDQNGSIDSATYAWYN